MLCNEFVEKLGGKIWVKSEEKNLAEDKAGGSVFHFTLPCSVEPVDKFVAPAINLELESKNQVKNLNILIAEDDMASEMLISLAMKMFGKNILKVRTGTEAVKACRNNPDIDLILMDIRMPDMDGFEATRQIRLFNPDVIIISQTAYAFNNENIKAIEAGCNDQILKPIKKAELKAMVQKYFGGTSKTPNT